MTRLIPSWLRQTLSLGTTPIPWNDVLRSGLTVPAPLAVGIAAGQLQVGLFGTLGALLGVLAERSGTGGQRLTKIAFAGTAGVVSMVFGRFTSGVGIAPLVLVIAFAAASGLLSSSHPTLSFAGMQLLVQMSIAGGLQTTISVGLLVGSYAAGVLWAMLGVWLQSALERTDRLYRRSAAEVVSDLVAAVAAPGKSTESGIAVSVTIEAAIDAAFDLVTAATSWTPRRGTELARARRVLNRLPMLAVSVDALLSAGVSESERARVASALEALASKIIGRQSSEPEVRTTPETDRLPADNRLLGAVASRIDAVVSAIDDPNDAVPPGTLSRPTVITRVHRVLTSSSTWDYTARVVLCMAVAEICRQLDPLAHSYWILLTTALILKPDFQSVFARTLQRGVGTGVGAVVAVPMLLIPTGFGRLVPMALLAAAIPWSVRRNYWTFTVLITPIVVLILDTVAPTGFDIVLQRLANTAIGCAVVLVFGYVLWPGTWRPGIRRTVSDCITHLGVFVQLGLDHPITADQLTLAVRTRHAAFQELNAMHTWFRYAQFEPTPVRRRVLSYRTVAHDLRLVADAMTRLFVLQQDRIDPVTPADLVALATYLRDVAERARETQSLSRLENDCAERSSTQPA
jgi:uncharacterized membrane protein YccC